MQPCTRSAAPAALEWVGPGRGWARGCCDTGRAQGIYEILERAKSDLELRRMQVSPSSTQRGGWWG